MNYRNFLSLTIGLALTQLMPVAFAATQDQMLVAAVGGLQGGSSTDTTLFHSRWSLPVNGALKKIEPAHAAAEEEENFPTPASVEAEEKRTSASKKAAKMAAPAAATSGDTTSAPTAAPVAALGRPGAPTAAAPTAESTPKAAVAPPALRTPAPAATPNQSSESPIVRLTIGPNSGADENTEDTKQPSIANKAPSMTASSPRQTQAPVPGNSSTPGPAPYPANVMPASSTIPNGAPVPGNSNIQKNGNVNPPAKTAGKVNTQA